MRERDRKREVKLEKGTERECVCVRERDRKRVSEMGERERKRDAIEEGE